MIEIIIDSTCDLPEDIIKEYNMHVLPLRVTLNDKEYIDRVTIQVDEVYAAMREGIIPITSQPSPRDIYDVFNDICTKGHDFIYLAFSSKMSGTYQLADSICREMKEKYHDIRMKVIDTLGGSTATGLIALQAAQLIKAGYGFDVLLDQIDKLIKHVEHVFTITDLKWMVKGGRLGKTQGAIGNILDIKPILDVKDGFIEVIRKVRGRGKALDMVMDILIERAKDFPDQIIGISHADDLKTAQKLAEMIKLRMGDRKIIINKIGSVLGSHLGIGGVGVFFFNSKPELYIK